VAPAAVALALVQAHLGDEVQVGLLSVRIGELDSLDGGVLDAQHSLPYAGHPHAVLPDLRFWSSTTENLGRERRALLTARHSYPRIGVKSPKITADLDELLAFYDYPDAHWVHLRTTNPIESTFATVRHRTKVTKGPGSKAAGLAMAFKLIEATQARWHAVNAPHLVALVRAGARFERGKLIERPTPASATHNAAAA
jgi:hypothetical protein